MTEQYFIAAINVISLALMGYDKYCARNGLRRIRESTLWLVAVCFGAPGETLGMFAFRHKTRHAQFRWGLPALAVVEIAVFVWYYYQRIKR